MNEFYVFRHELLGVCKTVRPMLSDRCLSVCPVCNICVLWPNGWMDQDATWYGGPGHIVLNGDSASPTKGAQQPPLSRFTDAACVRINRGSCLLWPNGWMDQDATWYGGRPWPRRHCVRWEPSFLARKEAQQPPNFPAHFALARSHSLAHLNHY